MRTVRALITGCSGGGKSTLLEELALRGHSVVAEPGRRVIAAERATGGVGMPWADKRLFARACLAMAERDWHGAGPGLTIFDHGVVDAAFALRRMGEGESVDKNLAWCRYDHIVVAPPWRALFDADSDPDRRHDFAAAEAEYNDILAGLRALGRPIEVLPRTSVAARADWLETLLRTG